jgi:hypothetical protein
MLAANRARRVVRLQRRLQSANPHLPGRLQPPPRCLLALRRLPVPALLVLRVSVHLIFLLPVLLVPRQLNQVALPVPAHLLPLVRSHLSVLHRLKHHLPVPAHLLPLAAPRPSLQANHHLGFLL